MRRTLRTTLLVCISLVSLIAVLTGMSALWSTGAPADGLHHLRSRLGASIDAERAALELHRTVRAAEVAARGGESEPLPGRLDALRDALRSLGSRDVARPPFSVPPQSAFTDLDRYTRRAVALAADGRRDEALRLLREDLSVMIEHRLLQPLAPWLASLDKGGIRSLDIGLSGAAQHWVLAPSLGEAARKAMLARCVEGILVLRLAREAAQEMRNADGATVASGDTEKSWKRLQRVARVSSGARAPDSELARAFTVWRAGIDAVGDEAALDETWRRFEAGLAPAALQYSGELLREVDTGLADLEDTLSWLRACILACIAIAIGVAVLAPFWISSRISLPLRSISEWADALRRGESDRLLPETANDEMGAATHSLREMANAFTDLTRRAETLAFYDSVTGLPNRRLLQERLQTSIVWAQINHRKVGLLTLSLSSFKEINDAHGHDVGDQILHQVANRLAHGVRLGDLVSRPGTDEPLAHLARLGGAEFTLMLTDIQEAEDAGRVAHRIVSKMSEPFEIDGERVFADPSVGIAIYPIDATDANQLVAHANVAAHHARIHSTGQYKYYSDAMNAAASRRLVIGGRLRGALERSELSVHLQPIRDARSGRVSCAEVLLRWNDRTLGPVPPSEFIPVAEELGLIGQIGDWVMRVACEQARSWRDRGFAPIRFAVNASPLQLRDEGWGERVAAILDETGVSADQLEIEITESSIMRDDGTTVATLTTFHEMGMSVALDDFGTGYSSLSYLRRFPIDRVKIDRSFVAEIGTDDDGTQLTAAMLAMAQSLRLRVVAEGIETLDQAEFLCARGCDELQGFLFSPPVPPEQFERFLELDKEPDANAP